jgi:hypothetical protein
LGLIVNQANRILQNQQPFPVIVKHIKRNTTDPSSMDDHQTSAAHDSNPPDPLISSENKAAEIPLPEDDQSSKKFLTMIPSNLSTLF